MTLIIFLKIIYIKRIWDSLFNWNIAIFIMFDLGISKEPEYNSSYIFIPAKERKIFHRSDFLFPLIWVSFINWFHHFSLNSDQKEDQSKLTVIWAPEQKRVWIYLDIPLCQSWHEIILERVVGMHEPRLMHCHYKKCLVPSAFPYRGAPGIKQ